MTHFIRGYKKDITGKKDQEGIFASRFGKHCKALICALEEAGYVVREVQESGTTDSLYISVSRKYSNKVVQISLRDHVWIDARDLRFNASNKPIKFFANVNNYKRYLDAALDDVSKLSTFIPLKKRIELDAQRREMLAVA